MKDFATTGDMVCIELPSDTNGRKQRVWLENHQIKSIYENRDWNTINVSAGLIVPEATPGLYAYIEDMTGSRMQITYNTNAIKYLHSKGNYDYTLIDSSINTDFGGWWNNKIFNFREGLANSYSGQSRWEAIKFEGEGMIVGDQ